MKDLTFSEIMEFYPGHNRSVYEDLKKDCRKGCLIPFVGAGLSAFCGYPGWPNVLEQLAEFIYDGGVRNRVKTLIAGGGLLQAAQEIYDCYPRMLRELRKIIDYEKIRSCDQKKLHASAAYVLPYLFRDGLVMTTNFDRVLEEVYGKCGAGFGKVVTPYEPDLLAQIRQSDPHCLFKLHGDIGAEIHDIERLVFTQAQYDKAYAAGGPLMRELPQWFQNKRLLFLGCSLEKDRTMEVLQQVTAGNPGLDHYAVLACRPEDIGRRCMELGELGISPIYYPPERHEAVRVVLERLLEETDYGAYEELSRRTAQFAAAPRTEHRFMYDSGYIAFTGREDELAQLDAFCQDSALVGWWAVTGPGGMGKSRLVYEFTNAQREAGWEVCWLKNSDYGVLPQWRPPAGRCIVVADDVQAHLQAFGEWMNAVAACPRSEKLKILLLERDGKDLNTARWAEMMQSDSPYDGTISSMCYRPDFLRLDPLPEEALKTIMENFAQASGRPLADREHAGRLLQTLQKIDGALQRPIYALAIVDAWCGGKDPARWDKKQVLEELVKRELRFYYDRLRNLSAEGPTKEMRAEFERLLARSCLPPFLPLGSIEEREYPKLSRRAGKLDMELPELLRLMGVVHRAAVRIVEKKKGAPEEQGERERLVKEGTLEVVGLDCPDLIKEYLVLQQALSKGQLDLILPEGWTEKPLQMQYVRRLLTDYIEELEGADEFWRRLFAGAPENSLTAWMYGELLMGVTGAFLESPQRAQRAMERLEALHSQFEDDEDVTLHYADGLANMIGQKSLKDYEEYAERLGPLHERFPANGEIAFAYARGLFNLTVKGKKEDTVQVAGKLAALHEQFRDSEEIALAYAKGLCNLLAEQEPGDRKEGVDGLRRLCEQFPDNEEIAVACARGRIALATGQTLEELAESAGELRRLYERFPAVEEIAARYAGILVDLALLQTAEAEVRKTLELSQELLAQYPSNTEIQLSYAKTQFNLTLVQEPGGLEETVAELRKFLQEHPDIDKDFQEALDRYLGEHPGQEERYAPLRTGIHNR